MASRFGRWHRCPRSYGAQQAKGQDRPSFARMEIRSPKGIQPYCSDAQPHHLRRANGDFQRNSATPLTVTCSLTPGRNPLLVTAAEIRVLYAPVVAEACIAALPTRQDGILAPKDSELRLDAKSIFSLDSQRIDIVNKNRLDEKIVKTQFISKAFLLNWKRSHHLNSFGCGVLRALFCTIFRPEIGISRGKPWQYSMLKVYPKNLAIALDRIRNIDVLNCEER